MDLSAIFKAFGDYFVFFSTVLKQIQLFLVGIHSRLPKLHFQCRCWKLERWETLKHQDLFGFVEDGLGKDA